MLCSLSSLKEYVMHASNSALNQDLALQVQHIQAKAKCVKVHLKLAIADIQSVHFILVPRIARTIPCHNVCTCTSALRFRVLVSMACPVRSSNAFNSFLSNTSSSVFGRSLNCILTCAHSHYRHSIALSLLSPMLHGIEQAQPKPRRSRFRADKKKIDFTRALPSDSNGMMQ